MTNKEKICFYQKYRKIDVATKFYEDIRYLKDISYQKIKEQLFDIKNYQKSHKPLWNIGVKIYDLRKEKYFILQRSLRDSFQSKIPNLRRSCYNLICEKKNPCFNEMGTFYGYSSFLEDLVLHVFENDAFSASYGIRYQRTGTYAVNRIMNSQDIIFGSSYINEIQILNEKIGNNLYQPIFPEFLISYNKVKFQDMKEALRLHLPIVLLQKKDGKLSYTFSTYIFDVSSENLELQKRLQNVCKREKT